MHSADQYQRTFLQRHPAMRRVIAFLILITLPISFPLIILLDAVRETPKAVRDLWEIISGKA